MLFEMRSAITIWEVILLVIWKVAICCDIEHLLPNLLFMVLLIYSASERREYPIFT